MTTASTRLFHAALVSACVSIALGQSADPLAQPKAGPPERNRADDQVAARPVIRYPFLRQDEDWSRFTTAASPQDFWDRIKHIGLGCSGCYLTLGGEQRAVYEYYDNFDWGRGPQDKDGFVTQRYFLVTDFHLGKRVRFFGQLSSNLEDGRTGGPRPYDEDRADVHQGFMDVSLPAKEDGELILRVGRQELFYGSGRLVEPREGLNTRITWDGALVRWRQNKWQVDAFAVRPVNLNRGVFDDVSDHTRQFWGVYATGPLTSIQNIDVYYLGLNQRNAMFDRGIGQQVRHTFGVRWWGTAHHWDYDDEAIGQVGSFAQGRIRAWAVATDHGYKIENGLSPRLGLRSDVASGDHDPSGKDLGTFSPLFPKGKYFGEADLNGPSNTIDVLPNFGFNATRKLRCTFFYAAFWRESLQDGVYGFATNLERSGHQSGARFIGQLAEVDFDVPFNEHALGRVSYEHFYPGEFLKDSGPSRKTNYVTVWWVYRF